MNTLILFDIDGTLTSSAVGHIEAHAVAYQKVFGLFGSIYMIDYDGKTDRLITKEVLQKLNIDEETIEEKMPEHLEAMEAYYLSIKPYISPKLLPGVLELLEKLSRDENILIGNVTGNLSGIAKTKLEVAGIGEFFKFGGFGEESYERADLVRNAIQRARGLGFVGDAIYVIGDTPSDIAAGIAAGVKTIGVATGKYDKQTLNEAGATVVLSDLVDFEAFSRALDS